MIKRRRFPGRMGEERGFEVSSFLKLCFSGGRREGKVGEGQEGEVGEDGNGNENGNGGKVRMNMEGRLIFMCKNVYDQG